MEFFSFHRDRPGSAPLRVERLESHWSYAAIEVHDWQFGGRS